MITTYILWLFHRSYTPIGWDITVQLLHLTPMHVQVQSGLNFKDSDLASTIIQIAIDNPNIDIFSKVHFPINFKSYFGDDLELFCFWRYLHFNYYGFQGFYGFHGGHYNIVGNYRLGDYVVNFDNFESSYVELVTLAG